ncbi:polymorphic toxin type 27 domain-containing protein [Streptomyces sp. NPDC002680]|uniref:polymorphic toxin type 27 domain-containing protein n=1 Tax=Streptomyces sp. NPDC002680 TaxID=3364659 RepID=UPI0036832BCA
MAGVLRLGGPGMFTTAQDALNQTPDKLHTAANRERWNDTPLAKAFDQDKDAAGTENSALRARPGEWKKPLSGLSYPGGFKNVADFQDPPGLPGSEERDFFDQVGLGPWIGDRMWLDEEGFYEDPTPKADEATVKAVGDLGTPLYARDPDPTGLSQEQWEQVYAEHQAWDSLVNRGLEPTGSDNARLFLASGGFPRTAAEPGTVEYRLAVEDLKTRFAACAWRGPVDPNKVLGKQVAAASAEWQQEIAAQAAPRNQILNANRDAVKALAAGSKALGEMLGQSWIADHLTRWQDYWSAGGPGWIGDSPMAVHLYAAPGKCLEVGASATASGTPVQIYTCNATAGQKWEIRGDAIVNVASGKCLDVNNAGTANGTGVWIWPCNQSGAQQWEYDTHATTRLFNKGTGKCLDLHTYDNGRDAWMWDCNGTDPQKFDITPSGHNGTDDLDYPTAAQFTKAKSGIAAAQAEAKKQLDAIKAQAAAAKKAATASDTAEQASYTIADQAGAPRGRGLLVGQQKAQVTKASSAALDALVQAGETAYAATRAAAGDSKTIAARALTQAAASKAAFRTAAANQARAQAKAAADAAAVQANDAKAARDRAKTKLTETQQAEADAKAAAATAYARRLDAEKEELTAKAEKETAAAKQAEAAQHKANAQSEAAKAMEAKDKAEAAEATAVGRRNAAVTARDNARAERDDAWEAEQRADAARAKADAKAAYADSLDAGEEADAARTAADQAGTYATDAEAAATRARSEADAATRAAADADAAATRAEAAAKRARSASDAANAAKLKAEAAVRTATSAAADAIQASRSAASSARTAVQLADEAGKHAADAKKQADAARAEAATAVAGAAEAAGHAYTTAQAADDARNAAQQVAAPANDAIQLGSPYITTDSAAGLAVLTGQSTKTIAEQQVAVAAAHEANAAKAAAQAQSVANAATGDAKAALVLASEAAGFAANARKSAKDALGYAAEAATYAADAQKSLARTIEYDRQATEDAAAADRSAGRAEGHAKDARDSADQAALDASAARTAAAEAEQAARDARAAADRADAAATEAEEAAKDADRYAREAQEAADSAEKAAKAQQIETGTVPDEAGGLIGGVFYVVDHIEKVGEPKVLKKSEGCDGWWDQLFYDGDCTMTQKIGYKASLDLYMCTSQVWANTCPSADTLYLGEHKTDTLYNEVTHTITIGEYQAGVDPVDILFGSWIRCAQKLTPGGENGTWGGCAWAVVDVVSLFAGKIIRPIADAVRAMDGAVRTGIGFIDAWAALRSLRLSEVAVAGIASKIMQAMFKACESATSRALPTVGTRVLAAQSSSQECIERVLRDLVKDGDHIVLGINPRADDLAMEIGARTFNNKVYGTDLPRGMGMGERPIWTVGVERTVSNPNVRLTVSLDGVAGATNADDALKLLLERGETIKGSDWATIRSDGYGTAWEMIKLRTAVRLGDRNWTSIEWQLGGKQVYPERFKLANGDPVP